MAVIFLVVQFIAGHHDLLAVDNHNKVARIHTGGVGGLIFAQQHAGDLGGEPSQVFAVGICHVPFLGDLTSFWMIGFFHNNLTSNFL